MMWTTRATAAARTALYSNKGSYGRIHDNTIMFLYHHCRVGSLIKRRRQFSTTSTSASSSKTPSPISEGQPTRRTRRKNQKPFSSRSSQSKSSMTLLSGQPTRRTRRKKQKPFSSRSSQSKSSMTLLSRLRNHTTKNSQRQKGITLSEVVDTAELMNERMTTRLQWLQDTMKESWKNLRLGTNNSGGADTTTPVSRQRQVELSHEIVMDANWWLWNLLLAGTPAIIISTYCQFIVKPRMIEANEKTSIARKNSKNSSINDNDAMSGIGLRRQQQQQQQQQRQRQWQQDGDHQNQERNRTIDASTVIHTGQDQQQEGHTEMTWTDHLDEIWTYLTGTPLFGHTPSQQQQQQQHQQQPLGNPADTSSVVSNGSTEANKMKTRRSSQYSGDNQTEMLREQLKVLQLQLQSLELQLDGHQEHAKDRTKKQAVDYNITATAKTLQSKEAKETTIISSQEVQEAASEDDHDNNAVLDSTDSSSSESNHDQSSHPSSSSWQKSITHLIGGLRRRLIDTAARKSDSTGTGANSSNADSNNNKTVTVSSENSRSPPRFES